MLTSRHRKYHCEDQMILRPSYLHNGISYTGKMASLYLIRAQNVVFAIIFNMLYCHPRKRCLSPIIVLCGERRFGDPRRRYTFFFIIVLIWKRNYFLCVVHGFPDVDDTLAAAETHDHEWEEDDCYQDTNDDSGDLCWWQAWILKNMIWLCWNHTRSHSVWLTPMWGIR